MLTRFGPSGPRRTSKSSGEMGADISRRVGALPFRHIFNNVSLRSDHQRSKQRSFATLWRVTSRQEVCGSRTSISIAGDGVRHVGSCTTSVRGTGHAGGTRRAADPPGCATSRSPSRPCRRWSLSSSCPTGQPRSRDLAVPGCAGDMDRSSRARDSRSLVVRVSPIGGRSCVDARATRRAGGPAPSTRSAGRGARGGRAVAR